MQKFKTMALKKRRFGVPKWTQPGGPRIYAKNEPKPRKMADLRTPSPTFGKW